MVIDLPYAAPEDVPDGHYQDVELYGEGVEPRSNTKDVRYLIVQIVPYAAGRSGLNDTNHVVKKLILSLIARRQHRSLQDIEAHCGVGGKTCCDVRRLHGWEDTVVTHSLLSEVFLHKGVQCLLDDGVDPEGKGGAETVHEGEPRQPLVLVDDHVPVLEHEEQLDQREEGVDDIIG